MKPEVISPAELDTRAKAAKDQLDKHAYEIIQHHFHDSSGCPFWLQKKRELRFDPLKEVKCYADIQKFPLFEDEWLRGGPASRWVPKAYAGKPTYIFETGGTTGIPKSRVVIEDHWIDYENFSATLPDKYFPKGANWLMLGPSGPRRLRLAVEHLAQFRGGICFCIDLDPRWVVKLIKKGWMEHLEAYKQHCIDQALTILSAGHDIKCAFATPKLLQSLCESLEKQGKTFKDTGITGIFSGGTEFTPQWTRFCIEEYFGGPPEQSGIYMTPTYGNTLMGLACSKPVTAEEGYKISYYAPQPRAVAEVVDFDDPLKLVPYGDSGRVKLTTLTKELFIPGFLERDEGEREKPYAKYPWDGVSGVKPCAGLRRKRLWGCINSAAPRSSVMSLEVRTPCAMSRATFHSVLDAPWTHMEPLRLGHVPPGLGTAARFVAVESEQGPLLRIDLYRSSEQCFAFEEVFVWSDFVAIGWGHHLYLVKLLTREASGLDLGSYFGHMYPRAERLLIASAECLFCVAPNGSLLWRSDVLGIDGVVVDKIEDGIVRGQGEWDPPGGWRPFSISLHSGQTFDSLY